MLGSETRRRIAAVEHRLDWLDEHGTRGVDSLRIQLTEQAKDIAAICVQVEQIGNKVGQADSARWQRFAAYALAIIPVYVLLILTVVKVKG